jgi:hypothetical protein
MNEAKQQRLNGTGERGIDDDWRKEEERKDETESAKGGERGLALNPTNEENCPYSLLYTG